MGQQVAKFHVTYIIIIIFLNFQLFNKALASHSELGNYCLPGTPPPNISIIFRYFFILKFFIYCLEVRNIFLRHL